MLQKHCLDITWTKCPFYNSAGTWCSVSHYHFPYTQVCTQGWERPYIYSFLSPRNSCKDKCPLYKSINDSGNHRVLISSTLSYSGSQVLFQWLSFLLSFFRDYAFIFWRCVIQIFGKSSVHKFTKCKSCLSKLRRGKVSEACKCLRILLGGKQEVESSSLLYMDTIFSPVNATRVPRVPSVISV